MLDGNSFVTLLLLHKGWNRASLTVRFSLLKLGQRLCCAKIFLNTWQRAPNSLAFRSPPSWSVRVKRMTSTLLLGARYSLPLSISLFFGFGRCALFIESYTVLRYYILGVLCFLPYQLPFDHSIHIYFLMLSFGFYCQWVTYQTLGVPRWSRSSWLVAEL